MTVLVGSDSCSDRSSHASLHDAVPFSSSLRGGYIGGTTVNHPTVYYSRLETPTVDSELEVSVLHVLMSRSLRG